MFEYDPYTEFDRRVEEQEFNERYERENQE